MVQVGVDHDIAGDLHGALVRVALAVDTPVVPLQGAADVELRVDDRPVAVDLDAFELRESPWPPPAALVYCDLRQVEADLVRVQLVARRDRTRGWFGQELGDEAAEGGVEGGAAAGGVGEERAAAGLEVSAQGLEVFLVEATAPRGRGCRSAGSRSGWGRAGTGPSGRSRRRS